MYRSLFQTKGLSLERLHTLVCVANAESLSAAAGHDPVRQSQFSRQLRELEAYFECVLTERNGKTLVLSAAGQSLAQLTQQYLGALDQYRRAEGQRVARLRLGANAGIFQWVLIPRLRDIEKAEQEMQFHFQSLETGEIIRRLHAGDLDAGIVYSIKDLGEHLQRRRLGVLRYILAVPRSLIKGNPHDVSSLLSTLPRAEVCSSSSGMIPSAGHHTKRVGTKVRYECASLYDAARLVESGHAAALLPAWAADSFDTSRFACYSLPRKCAKNETLWLAWSNRSIEMFPSLHGVVEKIAEITRIALK